eukprot:scaffold174851_cov36-Prasinocladus_malaysianus.AAC.1
MPSGLKSSASQAPRSPRDRLAREDIAPATEWALKVGARASNRIRRASSSRPRWFVSSSKGGTPIPRSKGGPPSSLASRSRTRHICGSASPCAPP